MSELKGSCEFLYYWDEEYGWIHISEIKKLKEAFKRFQDNFPEILEHMRNTKPLIGDENNE